MTRVIGASHDIAYYHASKFGNGAMVAEEFKKIMAAVASRLASSTSATPTEGSAQAHLYVYSSPGRMGKPKGSVRRFLSKASLEPGPDARS